MIALSMPVLAIRSKTVHTASYRPATVVKACSAAVRACVCCDPTRWIDDAHRGVRVGIGTVMAWTLEVEWRLAV
jgi:hypothetical protein